MIKGMIALSISPFLVVDDNTHIALKVIEYDMLRRAICCRYLGELPLDMCIDDLGIKQDAHVRRTPP